MTLSPTALAVLLGAAPGLGDTGRRFKGRYDRYSKVLLDAPVTPPGELTVTASARSFLEKRAALQTTEKTAGIADLAARAGKFLTTPNILLGGSLIGLGALGAPTIEAWGEKLKNRLGPTPAPLHERAEMDTTLATNYAKSVGAELGKKTVGLLGDFLSKAVGAPAAMFQNRERASIFDQLQQEDDVIAQADPQQLAEAYHTMVRFAPTLATDKNAVKTFLRESVLYGTGPNFMAIKQLADSEHAVNNTGPYEG